MTVVDASVVYVALVGDDDGPRTRERLADERLEAPALLDLEVAASLRRDVRHGLVEGRQAAQALDDLAAMEVRRAFHLPLMQRIWECETT